MTMHLLPLLRFFILLHFVILIGGYKIAIISLPWPGDTSYLRVLAYTLAERGHSVLFSMPSDFEQVVPKHENVRFLSSGPSLVTPEELSERIALLAKCDFWEGKHLILPALKKMNHPLLGLVPILKDEGIDVIIHPLCVFAAPDIAEVIGVPTILFQYRNLFEPLSNHLYGHRLEPAYVPSTGIDVRTKMMSFLERVENTFVSYTLRCQAEFDQMHWRNQIRDRLNLPRLEFGGFNPPSLVICASSWGLVPAHPVSPFIHLVGPLLPPINTPTVPESIIQFLDNSDGAVVIFQERLYRFDPEVINKVIKGMASIPRNIVWVALPQEEYGTLPPNVRVWNSPTAFPILSHPKVEGFFGAGGVNNYAEALWHGLPGVCLGAYKEHQEDCRALERSGAGLVLDKTKFSPEEMKLKILRTIEEPQFKEKAKQYARVFRTDGGAKRAAELVENLLFVGKTDRSTPVGMFMPWYQRDLWDVMIFVCICKIIFAGLVVRIVWFCYNGGCTFAHCLKKGKDKDKTPVKS